MSEPKCPICGGDLIKGENFPWFYSCQSTNWKSDADEICELDDCAASVPVWEALRRTRKALEIAVDALKDNLSQANFRQMLDASRFHCIRTKCESALEQIKELEQKD